MEEGARSSGSAQIVKRAFLESKSARAFLEGNSAGWHQRRDAGIFVFVNPSTNEAIRKRPSRPIVLRPEYGDAKDVRALFGIRGTQLYLLWKNADIKSIVIKAKGKERGKRLFDYASIRKFLAAQKDNS